MDIRSIAAEIERLEALAVARQSALDADLSKHVSTMDFALQGRLQGELAGFRDKIAELHEQRQSLLLDPAKASAPAPAAPSRSKARKAATATDRKVLEEYRERESAVLARFAVSEEAGRKHLTLAEHLVSMADLADVIRSLVARIEVLERADQFKGVFQRAMPYRRGSLVTYDGALWAALDDVPKGIVPGCNASLWQLAAKNGRPVKARKDVT